jgi:exosortase
LSIKDDFNEISSQFSAPAKFKTVLIIILAIVLFAPVIWSLLNTWSNSDDYSHGFFVIPIALFMAWRKRNQFISVKICASWQWFPILVFASLFYVVAVVTNFHTLSHLTMLLMIISLFMFLTGWRYTWILILPILFLIFMFPIPSSYYILITNPLKLMITDISAWIIALFNIPVFQDGNLLFFADTQLEVAEACSGIRSLYTYIMLSCVIAIGCKKLGSKIIMIISTIPLAIIVNIIRVAGTGVLGNYYGPKVAQGFFHEFTGFVLFIIGFIVLIILYYLLEHSFIRRLHRLP